MAGCCVHGNERSGFIKCGEILDYLSNYQVLKDSVPLICAFVSLNFKTVLARADTWNIIGYCACHVLRVRTLSLIYTGHFVWASLWFYVTR